MKGLFIKDFKLMMNQKMFFMVIAILGVFFAFNQTNTFFVISYATFIATMFVISSISYDEFNNGNTFLFTLPVSRTGYVKEKYLFGYSLATGAWVISVGVLLLVSLVKGIELDLVQWLLTAVLILMMAFMIVSMTIPVQLKFGQNRGNVAMLLVMGGLVAIGFVVLMIAKMFGIDLAGLIDAMSVVGFSGMVVIIFLIISIINWISYLISCKIMNNKEF